MTDHAVESQPAEAERQVSGAEPVTATSGVSQVMALQRGAGNAVVGRLLRRTIQRQQAAALTPPSWESCGWENADEVRRFLDERDTRIRTLLPTFDIATQDELRWYLRRWWNSTACIEQGIARWFNNDQRMLDRVRQQYKDALRVILFRAEQGIGTAASTLLTQNSGWIRQDAAQFLTDFGTLDRFERLDPSRSGPVATAVLRIINPAAPAFTSHPCTQNCPAAATAVQSYLRTGSIPHGRCNPMNEPRGYAIDPGPDTWGSSRNWANTWTRITQSTRNHGDFVLVEADRGPNGPANLTQWHYFVVLNVRGTRIVVDGFLGAIETDIPGYVGGLQAVTYKFTNRAVTATPVRP